MLTEIGREIKRRWYTRKFQNKAFEMGGVLIPVETEGLAQNLVDRSPFFSDEKNNQIKVAMRTLVDYYRSNKIGPLPYSYPRQSIWDVPSLEYRGMTLADLFIASIVTEGRITGGSQPNMDSNSRRRGIALSSKVLTTTNAVEAAGYANAKFMNMARGNSLEAYQSLLRLTDEEMLILERAGFFRPVVIEFDIHHNVQGRERRAGTKASYTEIEPYLLMSDISSWCANQLSLATNFNFMTGKLNNVI